MDTTCTATAVETAVCGASSVLICSAPAGMQSDEKPEGAMSAKDSPFRNLADLVRQARLANGLTQRQLSRAIGKSEGYVGHLESGRFRPTVETLKALASALGLSYGRLAVEAGYITGDEFEDPVSDTQLARLNEISDLTNEEWESVKDFARYVRTRRGIGR